MKKLTKVQKTILKEELKKRNAEIEKQNADLAVKEKHYNETMKKFQDLMKESKMDFVGYITETGTERCPQCNQSLGEKQISLRLVDVEDIDKFTIPQNIMDIKTQGDKIKPSKKKKFKKL